MKCLECGGAMATRRENYRYDACGLPGVTLVKINVSRCPTCGEVEAAIPNIEGLHRHLARRLTEKKCRLTGPEVRFLRKWLGWSGQDFAEFMGVAAETVSRWESGSQQIGPVADRLLRCFVLTREPKTDYSLDLMKQVARCKAKPSKLAMEPFKGGWEAATLTTASTVL